jgi:aspartyl-tRNA(Asn)/glutamyl-tRNA(Gln) amidotransferase subunit C
MISKQEVQHITQLARLKLSEKEVEKYQREFSKILDYVGKLKEIDVSKIKHDSLVFTKENITRKDEVLKFNKKLVDGHLKIKQIL